MTLEERIERVITEIEIAIGDIDGAIQLSPGIQKQLFVKALEIIKELQREISFQNSMKWEENCKILNERYREELKENKKLKGKLEVAKAALNKIWRRAVVADFEQEAIEEALKQLTND